MTISHLLIELRSKFVYIVNINKELKINFREICSRENILLPNFTRNCTQIVTPEKMLLYFSAVTIGATHNTSHARTYLFRIFRSSFHMVIRAFSFVRNYINSCLLANLYARVSLDENDTLPGPPPSSLRKPFKTSEFLLYTHLTNHIIY